MDNSKAIELLKGVAVYADTEFKAALNLGIAALEQQEQDRWHSVTKEGNPPKPEGDECRLIDLTEEKE